MSEARQPGETWSAPFARVFARSAFTPLLGLMLLLMTVTELAIGVVVYRRLRAQLEQDLARRLVHVSRLMARAVDVHTLAQMRAGDESLVVFQLLRTKLLAEAQAAGVDRAYVLDAQLRTLVDSHAEALPGRTRPALLARRAEAEKALAGEAQATPLYAGEDGRLRLSALAPAVSPDGRARVLVGVDASPEFFESLRALQARTLGLGLAGLAVTGVFGLLLLGQIGERLERLRRATVRASRGDLSARTLVASGDAIGALGRDLDRLIASIVATRDYYEAVVGGLELGLVATDGQGGVRLANVRASRLLATAEIAPGGDLRALVAGEAEVEAFVARALASRQPATSEAALHGGLDAPGGRVVAIGASPLGVPPGSEGVAFSFLDVTELRRLERVARRNERLASLGSLAGGLLHEMRNPLASLTMALDLLRPLETAGEAALLTERALVEGERLNAVLEDFRVFAGLKPLRTEIVALDEALDSAASGLTWPAHVRFERTRSEGARARADRRLLEHAARNLLQNALEALATSEGCVTAATGCADGQVWLAVEDDGPGMESHVLPHIFDPMFTTKPTGSGLGLAIVQRVAEAHGGQAQAGPRSGGGARFVLRLPAA